jgi:hypothetical protein
MVVHYVCVHELSLFLSSLMVYIKGITPFSNIYYQTNIANKTSKRSIQIKQKIIIHLKTKITEHKISMIIFFCKTSYVDYFCAPQFFLCAIVLLELCCCCCYIVFFIECARSSIFLLLIFLF